MDFSLIFDSFYIIFVIVKSHMISIFVDLLRQPCIISDAAGFLLLLSCGQKLGWVACHHGLLEGKEGGRDGDRDGVSPKGVKQGFALYSYHCTRTSRTAVRTVLCSLSYLIYFLLEGIARNAGEREREKQLIKK